MNDVVVVGAGPTGLAVGCALRLAGIPVRVVDRAAAPSTTSRANFLHARGSEVLHRLGALGDLPTRSLRALTVTTYLGGAPIAKVRFGDPGLRTAAPPMVISQASVEAALRDRFAELGGHVEWNTRLTGVEQDSDGVTVTFADGDTARAGWLVGCDGTGSTTRTAVGIEFPGVRISERYLLADVHIETDLDRTGTTGWVHRDGTAGAMPMPGADDLWRLLVYDPEFTVKQPTEEQIVARLREVMPRRTGLDMRIGDAEWTSMFSVHRRLAATYRRGRVLLAGDAAHVHSPFGGQGMLTGLGDAENVAWKLALVASGRADARLLDTYEAERRPLATTVLRGTTTMTRLNVAGSPLGRFLRDRVLAPIVSLPRMQRLATYSASQLWVSYRRGPLGAGRFGARPRLGDRVPDLPARRADGTATRLHAELGGSWALYGPESTVDVLLPAAKGELGAVTPLTGEGTGALLVRPDGHLAWRGGAEPGRLEQWLARTLHPTDR
jgi:2-polyprenyl-6-methoxyphenol hydroxylase-like FAD-dependent oxidoreductase